MRKIAIIGDGNVGSALSYVVGLGTQTGFRYIHA
jgi:malate/lactate dehydrogenase